MANSNGRIGPWSSVTVAIEGEPLAKDGLRKRREALEKIVEPYVTRRKTDDEILFRGKRRYLVKPLFRIGKKNFYAVLALQHLYNIEAAWKAGDIDKVVRSTCGFATADHDRQLMVWTGVDSVDGAFSTAQHRRNPSKGGQASAKQYRKRTPENERTARKVFASFHLGKVTRDAAYTRTIRELKLQHEITMGRTTLQTILKSPTA